MNACAVSWNGTTGPVKYRHEIVADALHSGFCHTSDVLAVVLDVAVAARLAKLDVLMYRNTLDNLKMKSGILHLLFQCCDALLAPHLSDRNVIHSRYDRVHSRDLTDVLQCHLVIWSIPAK